MLAKTNIAHLAGCEQVHAGRSLRDLTPWSINNELFGDNQVPLWGHCDGPTLRLGSGKQNVDRVWSDRTDSDTSGKHFAGPILCMCHLHVGSLETYQSFIDEQLHEAGGECARRVASDSNGHISTSATECSGVGGVWPAENGSMCEQ